MSKQSRFLLLFNSVTYSISVLNSRRDGPEQIFRVQKIIMHKDYDTYELENDIALMKLDRPALLTKQVSLICLPDQDNYVPIGKTVYSLLY